MRHEPREAIIRMVENSVRAACTVSVLTVIVGYLCLLRVAMSGYRSSGVVPCGVKKELDCDALDELDSFGSFVGEVAWLSWNGTRYNESDRAAYENMPSRETAGLTQNTGLEAWREASPKAQ